MTITGLQLARPRFHWFSIKLSLKNDHFGAPTGQAHIFIVFSINLSLKNDHVGAPVGQVQISFIFNQVSIEEWPFWGSSWAGPDFIDFHSNYHWRMTILGLQLARPRFHWFSIRLSLLTDYFARGSFGADLGQGAEIYVSPIGGGLTRYS